MQVAPDPLQTTCVEGLAEDHTPYSDDGPSRGLRTLARKTKRMIDRSVQLKNELQALLQRAHPELVQHLRGHVSQWVLKLIRDVPDADEAPGSCAAGGCRDPVRDRGESQAPY